MRRQRRGGRPSVSLHAVLQRPACTAVAIRRALPCCLLSCRLPGRRLPMHTPVNAAACPCTRAGKDYRDAVLKDAKTVLAVVAGGDPDLRQAVTDGAVKQVRQARQAGLHAWTSRPGACCGVGAGRRARAALAAAKLLLPPQPLRRMCTAVLRAEHEEHQGHRRVPV